MIASAPVVLQSKPNEPANEDFEINETQFCYEIKTFLLAGHETSAAMLTWSSFELIMNPQFLERVRH